MKRATKEIHNKNPIYIGQIIHQRNHNNKDSVFFFFGHLIKVNYWERCVIFIDIQIE